MMPADRPMRPGGMSYAVVLTVEVPDCDSEYVCISGDYSDLVEAIVKQAVAALLNADVRVSRTTYAVAVGTDGEPLFVSGGETVVVHPPRKRT